MLRQKKKYTLAANVINGKNTSSYSYIHISDTLENRLIKYHEFLNICKIFRTKQNKNNDNFFEKAVLLNKKTKNYICDMSKVQEANEISKKAELQNFMSSVEKHAQTYSLNSYMLTLTLSQEYLELQNSKRSFMQHSELIKDQAAFLRYFMKLIYSDRLTKYRMKNFFWMRMLEFTKKSNVHLHEALYLNKDNLANMIDLIGRKLLEYDFIGRTHLTIDEDSWNSIKDKLFHNKIAINEYLLINYSNNNFFNKNDDGAGKGFIIRVLTKRHEKTKNSKSSVSRYILKYLLKTRDKNSENQEVSIHKAVFSFLNINPFSFKRGVLFSLTKFRKIKNKLVKEKAIKKDDKHSLFTLAQMLRSGILVMKNKYRFESFLNFLWKKSKWNFVKLPKNLLGFHFEKSHKYVRFDKNFNCNYWRDFFSITGYMIFIQDKLFEIDLSSKYEIQI